MRLPVLSGIFQSDRVNEYAHTPYSRAYISKGAEGDFFQLMSAIPFPHISCF